MAYAALVSLSELLGHILHHPSKYFYIPLSDERKILVSLHEKSSILQSFLDDHSHKGGETVQYLETKIRCAMYEAQDIIECHISNHIGTIYEKKMKKNKKNRFHLSLSVSSIIIIIGKMKKNKKFEFQNKCFKADLMKALDQINLLLEEAMDIKVAMQSVEESRFSTTQTPSLAPSSQAGRNSENKEMVGYEEDLIAIQERLCGESSNLKIIPIVGMGGIGKTTLARNLFDDSLIAYHFHTRAWATVSQEHRLQGILLGILHSLTLKTEELAGEIRTSYLPETSDEDLAESVYRSLKGKRYLIVLDDMWSLEAWNDLRMIFPDDNNGSRIIVTTRLGNVAEHASSSSPFHQMHLLNDDESWNLLREKVFVEESCPTELEEIGKEIARNCGGLPLAIVVIAGLLAKVAMTEYQWMNIEKNVSAAVANADGNFSKILSLSYDHLPNHLKSCFLYMGAFSEDDEIPVPKLIKLWVAEGFLKPIELKTFEEAAEEYVEDLAKRNLITMTKKTWTGTYKFCGMHDLMRDLCIQKAGEEKFLAVVDRYGSGRGIDLAQCRRVATSFAMDIKASRSSVLPIRSLLQFDLLRELPSSLLCSKLVRVVLMPKTYLPCLPDEMTDKFHLRYLSFVHNNMDEEPLKLPSTISKLQNLQTLIIKTIDSAHVTLDVWKMPLLRHIILKGSLFKIPPPPKNCLVLENLQTVSKLIDFRFTRKGISKIPNVKELKLAYTTWSLLGLKNISLLQKLEMLTLDLHGIGIAKMLQANNASKIWVPFPVHYGLPNSLKRLSLIECRPPSEDMSIIGSLPNLEVLKLKNFDFVDRCWETKEGEFTRLRFLRIYWSNIINWQTESSHFPRLEHLILKCCWNLEKIPCEIGDIATLKVMEVHKCSWTAAGSALSIQKEQQSMGNEVLVVSI